MQEALDDCFGKIEKNKNGGEECSYKKTSSTTANMIWSFSERPEGSHYAWIDITLNFTSPNGGTMTGETDNIGLGWHRGTFFGTFQIN
jgi:hypothetical protein